MTLGEGKRKVLMLLDEYSSGGAITVDEDLARRMNDFFDAAQKDAAAWQPIVRRAQLAPDETGACPLPPDVQRVLLVRRKGLRVADWEVSDGRLSVRGASGGLSADYIAAPRTIGPETADDYEFEVSEAAANCLPFFVAAQQLVADLAVDYGAFYSLYLQMRAALPRTELRPGAGMRQALYR